VSLRKIDDATVEETDYRQGKVLDEIRLVLAKDRGTITYALEKQLGVENRQRSAVSSARSSTVTRKSCCPAGLKHGR
jgi:hypothetical protein